MSAVALGSEPQRRFARVEWCAAGLSFDGDLLPWPRVARVGIVIDLGHFGTDDSDWLVVEDDAGLPAWIEVTGSGDWGIETLLRGCLPGPVATPADVRWHDSGPTKASLNTVIWPPAQRGRPMFREQAFGIWSFRRVRLVRIPAS